MRITSIAVVSVGVWTTAHRCCPGHVTKGSQLYGRYLLAFLTWNKEGSKGLPPATFLSNILYGEEGVLRLRVHESGKVGSYDILGMCEMRMTVGRFQGADICGYRKGRGKGRTVRRVKKPAWWVIVCSQLSFLSRHHWCYNLSLSEDWFEERQVDV